jgi:putative SOS response-associated peptidase YedK
MPLILSDDQITAWLDPENPDPHAVLASVPAEELELLPVSDWVNNARSPFSRLFAPISLSEAAI